MEMSIMLLVVVVLLGTWMYMRSKRWIILLTATGPNAAQLEAKYAHLKSNNIKSKLVTDAGQAAGAGIVQADGVMPGGAGMVIKLKVHQKHMEQAKKLLDEFSEDI